MAFTRILRDPSLKAPNLESSDEFKGEEEDATVRYS
jgi:hypothetical protein